MFEATKAAAAVVFTAAASVKSTETSRTFPEEKKEYFQTLKQYRHCYCRCQFVPVAASSPSHRI